MTPASRLAPAAEAFALPFYAAPERAYHNATHVQQVLGALEVRGVLTLPLALAGWGHDLIYDARANDNEAHSAEVFGEWLAAQGAAPTLREQVAALILATSHTGVPTTREQALLVDADLGILGASAEEFGAYDRAIRREYGHVPWPLYREGRHRVLEGFLDRATLYHTPEFAALDGPARLNLRRAIAELQ
ncbi:hypothetical protein [Deinococcus sp. Leaf326]|uniref:HD domain-containing protein n=1 Tax=Deinococcus sp. Leaf326 TaxID=1736338 RepID=UPI0006F67CAC|nr:hypothetical protein [Deinococcus sp. Leaf326]KQR04626.1 phosphohydrolase [Deinococcus sp. Leaf326]